MARNPNNVKVLMWNVSSDAADLWFHFSNVLLISGATAVLIGTIGAITMGAAKEHFANMRLSENEKATAEANEHAKVADARAAEANEKAESEKLERLKLEAVVAPRNLSHEQQKMIGKMCEKFSGRSVSVESYTLDGEGARLAGGIIYALTLGKLKGPIYVLDPI